MPTYPMVHALVRHGSHLALAVGLAAGAVGIYLAVTLGSIVFAVVGIGGGGVLYVLLKSYSELVAIIADMMLPK